MAKFVNLLFCVIVMILCLIGSISVRKIDAAWQDAHATFYGDIHGGETMQGACGYGTLFKQIYGLETTALSTALFKNGATCGACFELMCVNDPMWCLPGYIKVTATNFCPPNYSKPNENWCNPPLQHFDLSVPMFLKIAKYKAGIVPVKYRRVLCVRNGGVKFELKGNPWWLLVLAFNVGGAGDVVDMKIKWPSTSWIQMTRNWGQNWQTDNLFLGQAGSFQVTTSDGKTLQFDNVLPPSWRFGQTYDGKTNFNK